jgi:probable rRNA maturation factor
VVRLTIEHGPHPGLPKAELLRRARAVSRALQLTHMELSIVLTKDDTLRLLNRTYRNLDRPTDVLAFAMREGEAGHLHGDLLGDVVVSVETARAQAARAGRGVLEEVTMLMVHGTLHLLGWDHDTRPKEAKMRAETERLCRLATLRASPSRTFRKRRTTKTRSRSASPGEEKTRRA